MKSILMSIKPKWIEKIASGEKTVEVRKSVPKCGTPFKVYMYCTNPKLKTVQIIKKGESIYGDMLHTEETPLFIKTYSDADEALYSMFKSGKVVGEFVCDEVYNFIQAGAGIMFADKELNQLDPQDARDMTCLTDKEFDDYLGNKDGYGLHISDLKIYDKPKELSEFRHFVKCNSCKSGYEAAACLYDEKCLVPERLTRPPQSWQYVEEQGVER